MTLPPGCYSLWLLFISLLVTIVFTWYQIHIKSLKYHLCVLIISKPLFPVHISGPTYPLKQCLLISIPHRHFKLNIISPTCKLLINMSPFTESEEPSQLLPSFWHPHPILIKFIFYTSQM